MLVIFKGFREYLISFLFTFLCFVVSILRFDLLTYNKIFIRQGMSKLVLGVTQVNSETSYQANET